MTYIIINQLFNFIFADFATPFDPPQAGGVASSGPLASFEANPEGLAILMSMGFTLEQATKALKATVSLKY